MTVRILLADVADLAEPRGSSVEPAPEAFAAGGGVEASRAAGPGRAYMARLRERQQASAELQRKADFLRARVARAVDELTLGEVCSPVMPGAQSFSVSHLVAREAVGQYRQAVDSLVKGEVALRLLVSGPWAPYSFTRIADE